jgi:hypothetical protein
VSRTSSERDGAHPTERDGGAFRRAFTWLTLALLVACAALVGVGFLQGPKLADVQLDTAAVISRPDQQVRLFVNQPVEPVRAEQVTVTPEVPVTVTSVDDVIAVQFGALLAYDTEYTVRVDEVRGVGLPATASLEYRFSTGSPQVYLLDRGEPDDTILRTGLSGSEREVVYSAPGIQSFAVTGQVLVVATEAGDGESGLRLVSLADGAVEEIPLPEPGSIRDLDVTTVGSVVGVTFVPTERSDDALGGRQLLLLDLEAGRAFSSVTGIDGEPLQATDWLFVPGRAALVAQTIEQTLLLVDAAPGSIPTPLGRVAEIVRFSRDGSTLAARDALGGVLIDLTDGSQTRLDPSLIEGGLPFLGLVEPLGDGSLLEKAALEATDGRFIVVIAIDDGETGRILYTTPDLAGSIEDFTVSPNGQFAAIEIVPVIADSVSDGYSVNPRATSITTVIMNIATGEIVRSIEGFGLRW